MDKKVKKGMTMANQVVEQLKISLANTYALYLQTQNFHWNVVGEDFHQYHVMFEEQYDDYAEAIDLLAENIRMLEAPAPGTFTAFNKLANVTQVESAKNIQSMLKTLVEQTEIVIKDLRTLSNIAADADLKEIEDVAIERLRAHTKFLWMLKSSLT